MTFYPHVFVTTVLLMVLSPPVLAATLDDVAVATLPSGMKVIVREGHAVNLAAVDVWIKAGSVNETEANSGVSHFVEHMIFKATRKYGPGQIDREIEGLGAELNGGTSRDWAHFYTTVASEYLPAALEILADAVTNAQFRPEDVERERGVILDEIARADSDPSHRAFDLFSQTAFAVHPYKLCPVGAKDSVSRLTREDLVAYYDRYYVPANVCVVIAGDIPKADAIALAGRAFAGFEGATQPAADPPPEAPMASPRVWRFRLPTERAYIVVGYHVAAADFKEICALDVVLALFGDTYRGRVPAALNTSGIGFDEIAVNFITQRYATTFSVLVSVDPGDVDGAVPVLLAEFRRLVEERVPPDELAQAKRLVEGGDLFEQETFSGQARALGLYDSIASSYDLALKYGSTVRSVSDADIMAAVGKSFGEDNYCVVIIEPEPTSK